MRVVALIGMGLVVAGLAWPSGILVVSDETGAARWRVQVAEGTPVVLQYTNSIYLAPTWERFVVRGSRLYLLDVSSTREAVLEYHRFAGPYHREGPRVTAPVSGLVLDLLPLRIGEGGRPLLRVGRTVLPLYEAGVGAGLRVAIRREPRLLRWRGGRGP